MTTNTPPPEPQDSDWVNVRDSWVGPLDREPVGTSVDDEQLPAVEIMAPASSSRTRTRPPPLPEVPDRDEPIPPSSRPAPFGNVMHSRAPSRPPRISDVEQMIARLAESDHEGALMAAETVLRQDPRQADALQCAQIARAELYRMYDARLGPRTSIPRMRIRPDQLGSVPLDVRAALVLGQVDGRATVDQVIHAGVLTKLDSLRVLSELRLMGIIEISDP